MFARALLGPEQEPQHAALIEQLAASVRITQQTAKGTAGTLVLAYMDFAVHKLLPDLLAAVTGSGLGIRIELTYMSTAQQRLALMDGKADLGLMIGNMSGPHVDSVLVAEEAIVAALPEAHRLAAKRKLSLPDVLSEPVLLGNETDWTAFREIIFGLYAQQGARPNIVHEASSAAALMGLTAKGLGITFYAGVPRLYQGSGLVFRRLQPERKVPISLVWRKGRKLPLVRQVLKLAGLSK